MQMVLKYSVCDIFPKKIKVGQMVDGVTKSVTMESSHFNHRPPHRTKATKCPFTCWTKDVVRYFDPCTSVNICSSAFRKRMSTYNQLRKQKPKAYPANRPEDFHEKQAIASGSWKLQGSHAVVKLRLAPLANCRLQDCCASPPLQ